MAWRGAFWWTLTISCIVVVLYQLISETRTPFIFATVLTVFAIGVAFGNIDRIISGIRRIGHTHFGQNLDDLTEVTVAVPQREWANICQTLQQLCDEQPGAKRYGLTGSIGRGNNEYEDDFAVSSDYPLANEIRNNETIRPLTYLSLNLRPGKSLRIPENAVYFLRGTPSSPNVPYAASLRAGNLSVVATTDDIAHQAAQLIESRSQQNSIYRGHSLILKRLRRRDFRIEFVETPDVTLDQLILPTSVLETLDRNVLQVIRHAKDLQSSQRNLQHGLLLYGPPGTGKTLAVRYLTSAAKPITVLNVSGRQFGLVKECCRLARMLAPTLVVLEDVDLIATDRAQSRRTLLLHDLLEEMDVRCTELPVIFLLTTNRPEVIEHALSLRPGRVNQAIQIPLPDDDCRLRLFQHFCKGIDTGSLDFTNLVGRSHGASAAFIEEWIRRAAIFSFERRRQTSLPASVTMDDFNAAIHEIVESGGSLTQKLLGHLPT